MTQKLSLKTLLLISLLLLFVSSQNVFSADLSKRQDYFKKHCDNEYEGEGGSSSRPNKLLLIDATDPLTEPQKQFLRDNFIENFSWKDEGEKVSIVLLNSKRLNNLDYVTLCTPLPEDKITFTMATKKEKKKIKLFEKTLKESFENLIASDKKADQSLLIESFVEIYRNERYGFLDGKRHLILASDLFQNSDWLSFFKVCKNNKCPNLKQTLKDQDFNEFMESEVNINHLDGDVVEIYHLKLKDKVVLSAKKWWLDFFNATGFDTNNLKVTSEL